MKTAILLSGGLDSVALSYWKRPQIAFTVRYGQLAEDGEVRASRAVCEAIGITHEVLDADVRSLGAGDLAGSPSLGCSPVSEWWPFRNQFLVTVAGMRALNLDVCELLVGSVKSDGVHVDGSEGFYRKLDDLMRLQEGQLRISAPAISMTSAELITRSGITPNILSWAHSCHVGSLACGRCRGCLKHFSVMEELGYAPY